MTCHKQIAVRLPKWKGFPAVAGRMSSLQIPCKFPGRLRIACVYASSGIRNFYAGKISLLNSLTRESSVVAIIDRKRSRTAGYALLGILFMLTLLIVAMGATAPVIKAQIQRNREQEMIHRGVQYSRAIKRFFVKFGRYPTSLEQLENTDHIRFLRKQYKDPMVSGGEWRLLHVGDVSLNWSNIASPTATLGNQSSFPGTAVQIQGSPSFGDSPGTGFGSTATSATTSQTLGAATTAPGGTVGLAQSAASGTAAASQTSTTSSNSAIFKAINSGAVIGVVSTSEQQGMHAFNETTKYNQWFFVYDPTLDRGALITRPYSDKTYRSSIVPSPTVKATPEPSSVESSVDPSSPEQSEPQQQ